MPVVVDTYLDRAGPGEEVGGQQGWLVQHKVDLAAPHLRQLLSCLQHLGRSAHGQEQEGMVCEVRLPRQAFWPESHRPQTLHTCRTRFLLQMVMSRCPNLPLSRSAGTATIEMLARIHADDKGWVCCHDQPPGLLVPAIKSVERQQEIKHRGASVKSTTR